MISLDDALDLLGWVVRWAAPDEYFPDPPDNGDFNPFDDLVTQITEDEALSEERALHLSETLYSLRERIFKDYYR